MSHVVAALIESDLKIAKEVLTKHEIPSETFSYKHYGTLRIEDSHTDAVLGLIEKELLQQLIKISIEPEMRRLKHVRIGIDTFSGSIEMGCRVVVVLSVNPFKYIYSHLCLTECMYASDDVIKTKKRIHRLYFSENSYRDVEACLSRRYTQMPINPVFTI